jgi:hypothetical protein
MGAMNTVASKKKRVCDIFYTYIFYTYIFYTYNQHDTYINLLWLDMVRSCESGQTLLVATCNGSIVSVALPPLW